MLLVRCTAGPRCDGKLQLKTLERTKKGVAAVVTLAHINDTFIVGQLVVFAIYPEEKIFHSPGYIDRF